MKRILSLILAGAFLHLTAVAQTNDPPPGPQPKSVMVYGFCLLVVGAGMGVVIYVFSKYNTKGPVTLVLEKSYDNGTWTPVFTNTVVLNGTNAIEFFRAQMTDSLALYRARRQQ